MNMKQFRKAQEALGLTNVEMAKLLCCHISHLEHMRAGTRAIRETYVQVIRQALREQITGQPDEDGSTCFFNQQGELVGQSFKDSWNPNLPYQGEL